MNIIILLPLFGVSFAIESRIKVGANRWAFELSTSDGNTTRQEYVDQNGLSHGIINFVDSNSLPRTVGYKFDVNGEDPEFSFNINDTKKVERDSKEQSSAISESTESTAIPDNTESIAFLENQENNNSTNVSETSYLPPNYESIKSEEDFEGHISLKVGSSVYLFNFVSGDRAHAREEVLDENGIIHGKYVYSIENKQTKVTVNYKLNTSGTDPTFEISMYKKSNKPRPEEIAFTPNHLRFYNPNQYEKRLFLPTIRVGGQPNGVGRVTISSTNPPHNVVAPVNGDWFYRIQ